MELNASELFISEECFQNVFRYYTYTWYAPITWQDSSIGGNQLLLFVICRQWVEKMASVDLSYSGFLHLLLLCHPISTFPPLPAIIAASSASSPPPNPFGLRGSCGGGPLLAGFFHFFYLLHPCPPPPILSTRRTLNSLFPISPTPFKLSQTTTGTVFTKVFNPLTPKETIHPHFTLKLLFSTAPTGLHIPHPSPKDSSSNYLPLPLNTIQNPSRSRFSKTHHPPQL